jgi:hypothetical protein
MTQLSRRFVGLDEDSRVMLSSLTIQQLEQLAEDLLDFTEPGLHTNQPADSHSRRSPPQHPKPPV